MKRAQVAGLVAGVAFGVAGVAAVALTRDETRATTLKLAKTSAELGAKGSKVASVWAVRGGRVAGEWAEQARKVGGVVARQASSQYRAQAPRAVEMFGAVRKRFAA